MRWAVWLGLLLALPARAAVLHVGAGHRFGLPSQAIAAAHPGDTVAIDPGTYRDCAVVRAARLTIRGSAPGVVMAGRSCDGKGILIVDARDVTVARVTLRGAVVPDGNGSGIRAEAGGVLTARDVRFVEDQDGILTASVPDLRLVVRDSLFLRDGGCANGGGCAHGIYANHIAELDVEHSRFQGIREGHDIKSRAARTVVRDSALIDGKDGTASYQVDLPNGGEVLIAGNRLEKGPHSGNPARAIAIGEEGVTQPTGSIVVRGNVLTNDTGRETVLVWNRTGTAAILAGNRLRGGKARALRGPGSAR